MQVGALKPSNALVAQGIEHRFPNPTFHVAKTGKRWEIRLFNGSEWLKTDPYRKTLEQDWSKPRQKPFRRSVKVYLSHT